MGMELEFLIPGMEHTEEADLGAEMFGIASDIEESFGTGLQQQMVQDFLVLQGEGRQLMGEGETGLSTSTPESSTNRRLATTLGIDEFLK